MQDGFYRLILRIKSIKNAFNATVHIEMKGPHGYLSAVEWPLLPVSNLISNYNVLN